MRFEINNAAVRRWRLRLAQLVAPAGADVHDPDDTLCPLDQSLLEAVFWKDLLDRDGQLWMSVTGWVNELRQGGLVDHDSDELTSNGQRELARLWGSHRIPPWSGGYYGCLEHGVYDACPGQLSGCPFCAHDAVLQNLTDRPSPWWSLRRRPRVLR